MGMSRYRPPKPKASPYITQEGYDGMKAELEALWVKRREVVNALAAAAAEGDRSENAEYIYRKKQLGGIDYRIRFLQKRIPELQVIGEIPDDQNKVFFGAWVTLENEEGREITYRIVGPDEFDNEKEYISMDSPVAKAMLRKNLDDTVTVKAPNGETRYEIVAIRYKPDN